MKTISIIIPTYNEQENVNELTTELMGLFENELAQYDYEIIFIDNNSIDKTKDYLRLLCAANKRVKAIFNIKNFGPFNSPYYGLFQGSGDCSILLCADFQDPIEMIPVFISKWEEGAKIVCGIKALTRENKLMSFLRGLYYKLIKKMSDIEQIENFTGFALYDKYFLNIISKLDDPIPFLRGIVAEFGYKKVDVKYEQPCRKAGSSSFNLYRLYDAAMISFTSYTKIGLRIATFSGFAMSFLSLTVALIYFVYKLLYWDRFDAGTTPLIVGCFVLGSAQLFFIGLIGEYILSMNRRIMKRPLVIEAERINFEE